MKLLTTNANKVDKSNTAEWLTAILYLEPSYNYNRVCAGSTSACRKSCLVHSGRMRMEKSIEARYRRTELYFTNKELFLALLCYEIDDLLRKAYKQGKKLAIRLNGTSDLDWSEVYKNYPSVQFYEYTKIYDRHINYQNVVIVRSASDLTEPSEIKNWLAIGFSVAKVFKSVPKQWHNIPVVNGDKHDRVWEHPRGSIIGLELKGTKKVKELALATKFSEE